MQIGLTAIIFLTTLSIVQPELQYDAVGNYFPSCVDVIEVYPDPGSILKPLMTVQDVYSIQVTFSKPVVIEDNRTKYILTPLLTVDDLGVSAEKVVKWRGSQRKLALFFNISESNISTG